MAWPEGRVNSHRYDGAACHIITIVITQPLASVPNLSLAPGTWVCLDFADLAAIYLNIEPLPTRTRDDLFDSTAILYHVVVDAIANRINMGTKFAVLVILWRSLAISVLQ